MCGKKMLFLRTDNMKQIKIFDTTLRDGEQSPGCSMNLQEKLEVAHALEKLKVDIIEAGFAISSPGDFESVKSIAEAVHDCTVASLARLNIKDIDAAYEAVRGAADPRIHTFIATSPLHMQYKLKMTEDQVLEKTEKLVAYAKNYCSNIEFSAEDATRSDPAFLVKVVNAAIRAGATTINIPDTVGYTTPAEMQNLIAYLIANVENSDKVDFAVHCHNDLGLGVANSLAGVLGGATQIECTINGLGERAGNTSLEEVVMAMRTRPDIYKNPPRIDTTKIYNTSKLVYNIIGQTPAINKPIVGANAFAHEAGIHQHGVLANRSTYEIMTPESVGITANKIVLGKHSGKHAFDTRLRELGYELSEEELLDCFEKFKVLCDKKKNISDSDLRALVTHKKKDTENAKYSLDRFYVHASNVLSATSTVRLKLTNGSTIEDAAVGNGPVDASYNAVRKLINPPAHTLEKYSINAVSEGKDSLGEAMVKIRVEGSDDLVSGRGLSTDIVEASIIAYINALEKII